MVCLVNANSQTISFYEMAINRGIYQLINMISVYKINAIYLRRTFIRQVFETN